MVCQFVSAESVAIQRGLIQQLSCLALVWTLVVAAVAEAGCPRAETINSLPRPDIPDGLEVDPPIDSREACPSWRWLALKSDPNAGCPDPGPVGGLSWKRSNLFEPDPSGHLPAVLSSYCLYEAPNGPAEIRRQLNQRLERLVRRGLLDEVESSCAAVGPMSTNTNIDAAKGAQQRLQAYFLQQTEAMSIASWTAKGITPRVRLALLDTQPDGNLATSGASEHGLALARMIDLLTCHPSGRQCAARVVPRLALPISEFSWSNPKDTVFDFDNGGHFGTLDHLATSVWKEVADTYEAQESHLIINMSVGWVGERFGGLEPKVEDMPLPVRSLYHALEVASCNQVLVVASSGHRVGGPAIETGALLPGAWQARPAPNGARCRAIRAIRPGSDVPYPAEGADLPLEPLLYAAGGVHANNQPLVNARPSSEPPLVAYADHASVADKRLRSNPPRFLTGSSVAAAVLSSAAAAVWHDQPGLSRSRLMKEIYASGTELGRDADVYVGQNAPLVRRIGVCSALSYASGCSTKADSAQCPLACARKAGLSKLPDYTADVEVDASTLGAQLTGMDFCQSSGDMRTSIDAPSPSSPCPFQQFFSIKARPWTGPQPQDDPCMGCAIQDPSIPPFQGFADSEKSSGSEKWVLYIPIDPEWEGGSLKATTLVVGDRSLYLEALSKLGQLKKGKTYKVYLDPADFAPDNERRKPLVFLQFDTKDGSVQSPVFVSYP